MKIAERAQFAVWGFTAGHYSMYWDAGVTGPHRREQLTADEIEAGANPAIDFFRRLQLLADLGLIQWVPHLVESADATGEIIHALGTGGSDSAEDRLGRAANKAAMALLTAAQRDWAKANKKIEQPAPVPRHMVNVQLVGIGRLRYRPHTRLTAAWWADLQTNSEPHIKEAVMKAMNQLASLLKDGYIPPSAVDWNDSGDNNAFHAKLCILDFGGTISIELAVIHNKEEYDDILTHGMPNDDQGKPVPAQIEAYGCVIPKGAKHPEVAREFLEYAIRPKVLSEYLKGSLGRWAIPMAKFAANDPFWGHNSDPHLKAYFQETLFGPTTPSFEAFNPAVGQIDAEHVFQVGIADIASHGVAPEAATDKALKRIGEIFKKYPIKAT